MFRIDPLDEAVAITTAHAVVECHLIVLDIHLHVALVTDAVAPPMVLTVRSEGWSSTPTSTKYTVVFSSYASSAFSLVELVATECDLHGLYINFHMLKLSGKLLLVFHSLRGGGDDLVHHLIIYRFFCVRCVFRGPVGGSS